MGTAFCPPIPHLSVPLAIPPTLNGHQVPIKCEALGWAFFPAFSCVLSQLVDTQALLSPLGEHGAKECADLTIDARHLPSSK